MRIVFFGSGSFAVPSLKALVAAGFAIDFVVSQPDRPAGRSGQPKGTPAKEAALELGLPVLQFESIREPAMAEKLSACQPDLAVIIAYGQKVPPELLHIPRHGFVNAHASLLPKYRGAAPVPHAIWKGEAETGVTIFRLEEQWDSGPVFSRVITPIGADDTAQSVLDRLAPMAAEAITDVARKLDTGLAVSLPQNHGEATRAPKLSRDDGRIDWQKSFSEIDRQVRAFQPWPEAFTSIPGGKDGKPMRLQVLRIVRVPDLDSQAKGRAAGEVLQADAKAGLIAATGAGEAVLLERIKPEGKREMAGAEYLRGKAIAAGTVLGA